MHEQRGSADCPNAADADNTPSPKTRIEENFMGSSPGPTTKERESHSDSRAD
jgi:hypothetical protein